MDPHPAQPQRRSARPFVAAAIAATTAAVFAPAASYDFVGMDDWVYLSSNPIVRDGLTWGGVYAAFAQFWAGYWIPLTWLSLQLDVTCWGSDPRGFHVVNIALHSANAGLLYLVLLRLTGAPLRCAAVALLWALHPLRVESVAWVTERKDVLSGLFGLLCVWAYTRYAERRSDGWMAAVFAFFVLGMMAKPALIALPCCLLLLDAWPLKRLRRAGDLVPLIREKAPLFLLVVAFTLVTLNTQDDATVSLEDQSATARVRTAFVGYGMYVVKTVWPDDLAGFHPLPDEPRPLWQPVAAAALLAALTAGAVALRHRSPAVLVGWLWFLGTLFPTCGVMQSGLQEYADRFTYWPHIGLMFAVVFAIGDATARARALRPVAVVGLAALIVASAVVTRQILPHWRNSVALYSRILAVHPEYATGWRLLGECLVGAGDREGGRKAFAEAMRLQPGGPLARVIQIYLEEMDSQQK